MRILLVEDEVRLNEALVCILNKQNYLTDSCTDGSEGLALALTGVYDVIILDRMLPGKEGVVILREIRAAGIVTPVIFLTAKDAVTDRIEGLDAGADDYLVKPFSKDELLARIRALGRRPAAALLPDTPGIGSLSVDCSQCLALTGQEQIKLTLKETHLLEMLIRNAGQVLSKEQILDRVWGFDSDVEPNSVELYIYYLRKKIDFKKCGMKLETIRGVGYSLRKEQE